MKTPKTRDFLFYMGLAALFAHSRINAGGAKILIKSFFIKKVFEGGESIFSVHSAELMCQANILPFGINC